jgi:hypothetical protein
MMLGVGIGLQAAGVLRFFQRLPGASFSHYPSRFRKDDRVPRPARWAPEILPPQGCINTITPASWSNRQADVEDAPGTISCPEKASRHVPSDALLSRRVQ